MSAQPELFPMTEEERIALLRKNLQADVDKRQGKVFVAEEVLADARDQLNEALGMLDVFDTLVHLSKHQQTTIGEDLAALVNTGILDTDGITCTATSGRVHPEVDPVTGEIGGES